MNQVFGCLIFQHDHSMVALAALICLTGSALTLRLVRRLHAAQEEQRLVQLGLTGLIAGATVWTTHFIAMIGYEPGVNHAFDPALTAGSLFLAILGATFALAVAITVKRRGMIELGGAAFGLTVTAMHYLGMQAFEIPGQMRWDPALIAASAILGAGLGAASLNRSARAETALGRHGAAGLMMLAVCAAHFTGMGAFTIEFDPATAVPPNMLSNAALSILVLSVMSLFMLVGLAMLSIEAQLEANAKRAFQHARLHDSLTGLPNRAKLKHEIDARAADIASGAVTRLAILTIDLNRFKEINDVHGHAVGDTLLQTVASRLDEAMGRGEFVARSGGDEFLAIKTGYADLTEVGAFADRLFQSVVETISVGGVDLCVGASIGVAAYPEHSHDLNELQHKSDIAMYRAKESLLDAVCFFDAAMDDQSRARIELTNDLRQALALDQFELHYQPQNDVGTRDVVGFEVLLRWNHPSRGRVPPAEFIPLAESTGLIRSIGEWVLRKACLEAASWPRPLRIAVNVAPQQLVSQNFVDTVADALHESGLDPRRLELEITEASIIDDHQNTLAVMRRLKAMGIRIAMDDFGTGYSSLAALRSFPFDKIKIDRSFVEMVHKNEQSAAIVRSTLLLGGALQIPVLAEGVENEDELMFLGAERCAEVQGFLFGRPMDVVSARRVASGELPQEEIEWDARRTHAIVASSGEQRVKDSEDA